MKPVRTALCLVLAGLLMLPATGNAAPRRTRSLTLYGELLNALTRQPVEGTLVELLRPDSSLVDSCRLSLDNRPLDTEGAWSFRIPAREGQHFVVRATHPDYGQKAMRVDIDRLRHGQTHFFAGCMTLRKAGKDIALGEARVRATRIKFYNKGDTLVYNADAFRLSEGSMLDALIRQLPGAVLKDDGRILVNGRPVESLLLNGEDFFKGRSDVMLDNLPAYVVSHIQVYERASRLSEFLGHDLDDRLYVMDVKLKRQYAVGLLFNAEGGTGSENRYMGRLFGMRFTPQSRLSVYGNANNVNETRRPGTNGTWSPDKTGDGPEAVKTAGVDYSVSDKYKRFSVNGNAQIAHSDAEQRTRTALEDFLPQGHTYGSAHERADRCRTTVQTSHTIDLYFGKSGYLWLNPQLEYERHREHQTAASATFSENPYPYAGKGLADSIMQPEAGDLLRRMAINRRLSETQTDGHSTTASLDFSQTLKSPHVPSAFNLTGSLKFSEKSEEEFDHYRLDYPRLGADAGTDYRNRWTKNGPERENVVTLAAERIQWIGGRHEAYVKPYYKVAFNRHTGGRALYRLDRLEGWGEDDERPLGMLPSEAELLAQALDAANSYRLTRTDWSHETGLVFYTNAENKARGQKFSLTARLVLRADNNKLSYSRNAVHTVLRRHPLLFNPSLTAAAYWHRLQRSARIEYRTTNNTAPLLQMVDIRDDANPLFVMLGNPNLKAPRHHMIRLIHQNNSPRKQRFFNASVDYTLTERAIAQGFTYDRSTGIRTCRPENVSGNYRLGAQVDYSMPLDRQNRLTVSTATTASLHNNADLMGTDGAESCRRSTVQTCYTGETLLLEYDGGTWKAGAKAGATWTHATSRRPDFSTIDAGDMNYGLTGRAELPGNLSVSTDLTLYSRRGYEDRAMNTDDLVWNGSLEKAFPKLHLTLALDGFDLLHNLSGVTRHLNGQGRTETYRNVIPAYLMLRCIFRLNVSPKEPPGA